MRDRGIDAVRPAPARVVQVGAFIVFMVWFLPATTDSGRVGPLVFSGDGRRLVGAVNDHGVIRVWDADDGRSVACLAGPGVYMRAFAASPDGLTLAVVGDSTSIELWDLGRGARTGVLTGHAGDVGLVEFDPSGAVLASASYDGEVRLWDVTAGRTRTTFRDDPYGAVSLMFAPDGNRLAVTDVKGVQFRDASDGRLVGEIRGERLRFLGFTEAGRGSLLTSYAGRHGQLNAVVDGAAHAERFVLRPRRQSALLAPGGRTIAFGDRSGTVTILDAASGRSLFEAGGLSGRVDRLAFAPDGKLLAAADEAGSVRIWETGSGKLRASFSCGGPVRRWGPTAAAALVWAAATIRLRFRMPQDCKVRDRGVDPDTA